MDSMAWRGWKPPFRGSSQGFFQMLIFRVIYLVWVMMNHRPAAPMEPSPTNQLRLMPEAKRTEAAPTAIRMVPDMWGSKTTSPHTTSRTTP